MPAYQVTDKAGQWVAGKRVRAGDILQLSERQAEHEFRLGTIAPVGASQAAPQAAKAAPATTPKAKAQTPAQAATSDTGEAV
jgi:hypothetical protein